MQIQKCYLTGGMKLREMNCDIFLK
jgi:hypothetical protein